MPKISIIIPTYNGEKYIVDTITSVLKQDFMDYEIIVIIDGTTDNTKKLIQNMDSRIVIVEQENKGIAEARNTGIRQASGEFIAFLDHDDIWHPGKLSAQLECFKLYPKAGVIFGEFIRWDGKGGARDDFFNIKLDQKKTDKELTGWIYHKFLITNWVLFSTALFKREVIQKIGFFNPELPPSDDWDFIVRTSLDYELCKIEQPLVLYRIYENQTSRKASLINAEVEFRKKIISQHGITNKHGQSADPKEINYMFFKNYFDFGLMHYYRGSTSIAINSFLNSIKYKPGFYKSYIFLILSFVKYIFGIRNNTIN